MSRGAAYAAPVFVGTKSEANGYLKARCNPRFCYVHPRYAIVDKDGMFLITGQGYGHADKKLRASLRLAAKRKRS